MTKATFIFKPKVATSIHQLKSQYCTKKQIILTEEEGPSSHWSTVIRFDPKLTH